MHREAWEFVAGVRTHLGDVSALRVLEIGSRNVNGSPRDLFRGCAEYVGVDVAPGNGVDIVADCREFDGQRRFDICICMESMEHDADPAVFVRAAEKALRDHGLFIVTAAAPPRPPHSCDGEPLREGYYGNILPEQLEQMLAGWGDVALQYYAKHGDVYASARRPYGSSREIAGAAVHHETGNLRKHKKHVLEIPKGMLSKIRSYFGNDCGDGVVVNTSSRVGRLINLAILCDRYKSLNCAFVECGVAKGQCLSIMKYFSDNESPIWGFDSFEGMPSLTEKDEGSGKSEEGVSYSGGIQEFYESWKKRGLVIDGMTHIVRGLFKDTFPYHHVGPVSILRLDADWYEATMECLEEFYDSVIPGGVIIIDDYGAWKGCHDATDEFREKRKITEPFIETKGEWSEVYWFKK